jgi:hypothetical protein
MAATTAPTTKRTYDDEDDMTLARTKEDKVDDDRKRQEAKDKAVEELVKAVSNPDLHLALSEIVAEVERQLRDEADMRMIITRDMEAEGLAEDKEELDKKVDEAMDKWRANVKKRLEEEKKRLDEERKKAAAEVRKHADEVSTKVKV